MNISITCVCTIVYSLIYCYVIIKFVMSILNNDLKILVLVFQTKVIDIILRFTMNEKDLLPHFLELFVAPGNIVFTIL